MGLKLKITPPILSSLGSSIISEKVNITWRARPNPTRWQTQFWLIQDFTQHLLLSFSCQNECESVCVVQDGVGEGDSLGRRFRAILDGSDPPVLFAEQFVTGEEGACVTVWAHSEEDEVEDGVTNGFFTGKSLDELLFVCVTELFWVVKEGFVDGVDLRSLQLRNFGEELLMAQVVVGVFVVERDKAFVAKENLPLIPPQRIILPIHQALGEHLRERPA